MSVRLRDRARFLAYRLGLKKNRFQWPGPQAWDEGYGRGEWDYMARLDELAHYSLLTGYVRFFGGEPEILEVGCGPGFLRERLEGVPFARYLGIDPSRIAVDRARSLTDERTEFVCGDLLDTDVGTFDVVLCNEVLPVVPDSAWLLDRIVEVLRPQGLFLVSVYRHPGDVLEWRAVEDRFEVLDRITVRNDSPKAPFGWQVACCRVRK